MLLKPLFRRDHRVQDLVIVSKPAHMQIPHSFDARAIIPIALENFVEQVLPHLVLQPLIVPQPLPERRWITELVASIDNSIWQDAAQRPAHKPLGFRPLDLEITVHAERELRQPVIEERHARFDAVCHTVAIFIVQQRRDAVADERLIQKIVQRIRAFKDARRSKALAFVRQFLKLRLQNVRGLSSNGQVLIDPISEFARVEVRKKARVDIGDERCLFLRPAQRIAPPQIIQVKDDIT